MTRTAYSAWLFGVAAVVGTITWATFAFLGELAAITAPLGLNATSVQNVIVIAAVALGYILLSGASATRARSVAGYPYAVAIGLLPVLTIAVFNGPLFFNPYLPMPGWLQSTLLIVFGAIATWGIGRCLLGERVR